MPCSQVMPDSILKYGPFDFAFILSVAFVSYSTFIFIRKTII